MRDFEAYYAAGAASLHGDDPYSIAIWTYERTMRGVDPNRREVLPFVGPPATLPLWRAFAKLPEAAATAIWRTILIICAALAAFMCARRSRVRATLPNALAVSAIALAFGPLTSDLALGQIALAAFAAVLLANELAARYPLLAGLSAGLAFAQPNVGIVTGGIVRDRRSVLILALGFLLFVEMMLLNGGAEMLARYAGVLQEHGAAERFASIQITPAAILYGFGVPPGAAQFAGTLVALAATLLWILAVRAIPGGTERLAFTCALAPLAMPFFHEHDLAIVLLPALFVALRERSAIVPAAFLLCSIDWLGLAQRPDGTVQTVLLASGGLFGMMWLRTFTRVQLAAALATIAAAAVLGALAAHHPLGVWPDAMRAFALPPDADIARTWEAEQRAAGLMSPDTFVAALRLLPLVGTALLAAGFVRSRVPADSRTAYTVPASTL